ncbi:caspase Dronc [Drosophila tropicalis]|uniref:caspase Dronc n=1 Tax=Drosophila tropicalis TaxID=46794 RepID=UPI0035AB73FD
MDLRSETEQREREIGMPLKLRNHIIDNIDILVKNTNYTRLATECVRLGMLTPIMRKRIEDLNGERLNLSEDDVLLQQHRNLFVKITKRGPTAYGLLLQAVRSQGCLQAVQILESTNQRPNEQPFISIATMQNNRNSTDIVDTTTLPVPVAVPPTVVEGPCASKEKVHDVTGPVTPYEDPVVGQTRVVLKSDRIHDNSALGIYTMQTKHNRGVLFMVNIIDFPDSKKRRNGAEIDSDSLIHIFREMGFIIFAYKNVNQDEFFDMLRKVTSSTYVQTTECFVMVLMTHGERVGEVDKVEFCDGSVADVIGIKNHFRANSSPYLVHKPKVLIFPFCRGRKSDPGLPGPMIETDGVHYSNVPTLSDMLVSYASTAGNQSHRDPDNGSWYIQKFCDTMANHAHNTHVEDILKITHTAVGNMRTQGGFLQTGTYDNIGFNKKLYFNPGFYLEPKE